jgi:vacuolar-type H+-ATPase subunit I/STV1
MRALINIVGILLIIFGIITFTYQGFNYTQREKVAQIGNVEVTANTEKTIYFSPMTGGLSLVVGVILVVIGRRGGV